MVIIFYDTNTDEIYICTNREKMKRVGINDPDLLTHIPNDDILYVSNGHFITKSQFENWLSGDMQLNNSDEILEENEEITQLNSKKFIHPTRNGAIFIPDISSDKYPEGVELIGKYTFICVDDVGGEEALKESTHYRVLLKQGKIEVVDWNYVKMHKDKKDKVSLREEALNSIIIKNDIRGSAESVAAAGGISGGTMSDSGAVELYVE